MSIKMGMVVKHTKDSFQLVCSITVNMILNLSKSPIITIKPSEKTSPMVSISETTLVISVPTGILSKKPR